LFHDRRQSLNEHRAKIACIGIDANAKTTMPQLRRPALIQVIEKNPMPPN
jgi:hypothetical protein